MQIPVDFRLTESEKDWFAERMDETQSGRVQVPSNLYKRFKRLVGNDSVPNHEIKCHLIDYCYNSK